jgi:hypothetical protein
VHTVPIEVFARVSDPGAGLISWSIFRLGCRAGAAPTALRRRAGAGGVILHRYPALPSLCENPLKPQDLNPWTGAPCSHGFPVELVGVGELHAAFLTESRTRSRRLGPRAGNPGRTSVHGLNRTGKALPKLSLQRSHRERSSKSIRKRSYPAHVRWGKGHPSWG